MEDDRQLPPDPATPTGSTECIFARFQARDASSHSAHSPTVSPPLSGTAAQEEAGVSSVVGEKSVEERSEEAVEEFGVELEQAADGEGGERAAEPSQGAELTEYIQGECLGGAGGGGTAKLTLATETDSLSLSHSAATNDSAPQEAPDAGTAVDSSSPFSVLSPAQTRAHRLPLPLPATTDGIPRRTGERAGQSSQCVQDFPLP